MQVLDLFLLAIFGLISYFVFDFIWDQITDAYARYTNSYIDVLMLQALGNEKGKRTGKKYAVTKKEFAAFRTVDIYEAVRTVAEKHSDDLVMISTEHNEDLNNLLNTKESRSSRKVNASSGIAWATGRDTETYLTEERFWLASGENGFVVRCKYNSFLEKTTLELASNSKEFSESLHKEISRSSVENSIYKNEIIALSFESGSVDEYGDVEKPSKLSVNFNTATPISKDDFVADDEVFGLIKRNVIDLQVKRKVFKHAHIPSQRGVLFYGPPGTGKSYACRYICNEIQDATRIFITGSALSVVPQIFELARLYQPSILFMEDVDLIFSSRDINLYSSALGDLLDNMDGLRPMEEVSVLLTTNSIERMEAAIKDRPGRISQCIYFGAPPERIRQQYIEQYARRYNFEEVDMKRVLDMSEGATPAFIKEWVNRSVQFSIERIPEEAVEIENLQLITADFENAYNEMRLHSSSEANRIIGFIPAA